MNVQFLFFVLSAVFFAIGAFVPIHKSSVLNWTDAGLCCFVIAYALT